MVFTDQLEIASTKALFLECTTEHQRKAILVRVTTSLIRSALRQYRYLTLRQSESKFGMEHVWYGDNSAVHWHANLFIKPKSKVIQVYYFSYFLLNLAFCIKGERHKKWRSSRKSKRLDLTKVSYSIIKLWTGRNWHLFIAKCRAGHATKVLLRDKRRVKVSAKWDTF